jgi:hypothetical protein
MKRYAGLCGVVERCLERSVDDHLKIGGCACGVAHDISSNLKKML